MSVSPVSIPYASDIRHDWTAEQASEIYQAPLNDLLYRAHTIHRRTFDPNQIQLSSLLSLKTGACPEDCAYCPQSVHHDSAMQAEPMMDPRTVITAAKAARTAGATRFCMGAAWRSPKDRDLPLLEEIVRGVKAIGLETCLTLGMLTERQAVRLAQAGLDYYNHNLDTSPEYYPRVITTRTYTDRLRTLHHVRAAGIAVCSGGILGMGESAADRIGLLLQLANLPRHPESVPINLLVQVQGTPLAASEPLDPFEFIRTVALARILMPCSVLRLSAGRDHMTDEMHALCFFAGANSLFYGEKLLTTGNSAVSRDNSLFTRLGLRPQTGGGRLDAPASD